MRPLCQALGVHIVKITVFVVVHLPKLPAVHTNSGGGCCHFLLRPCVAVLPATASGGGYCLQYCGGHALALCLAHLAGNLYPVAVAVLVRKFRQVVAV